MAPEVRKALAVLALYFMALNALLSALLSNTAATAMVPPIAMAVMSGSKLQAASRYGTVLLLGIAYAATIVGVSTLVGTPPNVLLSLVPITIAAVIASL